MESSAKTNKKQSLTSYEVVSLLVLIGVITAFPVYLLKDFFLDDRPQRAAQIAENLALQLSAMKTVEVQNSNPNRGPASVSEEMDDQGSALAEGRIGRDPWGQAFRYLVGRGAHGEILRITVVSAGPNSQFETSLNLRSNESQPAPTLSGDDILFSFDPNAAVARQ